MMSKSRWTEQDYREAIEDLTSAGLEMRVSSLLDLAEYPSGDPRILPYLERYLTDTTVTLLWIPMKFGEVRWLAAHALAMECLAQDLPRSVVLHDAVEPMSVDEIGLLARQHGIDIRRSDPNESVAARYQALRDGGFLPRRRVDFTAFYRT